MTSKIRIGTRESDLATWQARQVEKLLTELDIPSELVFIKSEGDTDLHTPLYEMGVQGIFTRSLDIALLNNRIDIAVHSFKDVPTRLAEGTKQAAVLKRGNYKDLFVFHPGFELLAGKTSSSQLHWLNEKHSPGVIATSSIRRKAQWLHLHPGDSLENLRGNVNTRMRKLNESNWAGAIFAAAGLERINLRPENSIELEWMLPAPAQGAIVIVCRKEDDHIFNYCQKFNNPETELCTGIERAFLRELQGGCSTPISALAREDNGMVSFRGSILAPDGSRKIEIERTVDRGLALNIGSELALMLLKENGEEIREMTANGRKN